MTFTVFMILMLIIITYFISHPDTGVSLPINFLVFLSMMDPHPRTFVLGDSHVRRLHTFMLETPDAYTHKVFPDMALSQRVDFHGIMGRRAQGIFDFEEKWNRWYSPHVVFFMLGGNALSNSNLSALDVASKRYTI